MSKLHMNWIPFVFCSVLMVQFHVGSAQTLDYYYTFQSTDNWTEINNDVVLFSGNFNDEVSASLNIVPFTMGVQGYVNFFVSTNGFITLGQAPAANDYDPLSQGIGAPVIAPFAANLEGIDATSKISYSNDFSGFRIQWKNVRRVGYPGESFSFQIKLINNAITGFGFGAISFLYGPFQGVVGPASQVQVGIRVGTGTGISTFSNRSVLAGQPWAPDQSGAASNASCTFPSTSGADGVPALGMLHQWFLFAAPYIDNPDVSPNCNTQGNVVIYSNYDGGILTINCDENIPNLKIGICTYEPIQVSLTGPFVGNVTQVLYAGFNSVQGNNNCGLGDFPTSITGVNPGIVQILTAPSVGDYDPYHSNGHGGWGNINSGAGLMVGVSGQCDTLYPAGGGNTPDEVVYYFMTELGGSLQFHYTQYSCWLNETLDISDGGNCCINPLTPNWDIVISNGVTVCSGENVSLELLTNSNGSGPFQYEWTYGGAFIGAQASLQYVPTMSGEACLTVTDANGNSLSQCTNVLVNESLDIQLTLSDSVGCLSSSFILTNNANLAEVMSQQWVINGDALSNQASFTFTPLNPGSYDVQLLQTAVNGCISDTLLIDAVVVYPPPNASFTSDPLILEADQTNFSLINLSTGSLVSWQWSIGLTGEFGVSNDTNPTFSLPWGIGGVYPIQLVVLDSNGCSDQVQGEIVVNALFSLYVPNTFTPNNDGINDALELVSSAIVEGQFEMSIFNRWGQCVYFSKNPDDAWDGSLLGGDYYVEDGVYPYVIKLTADGDVESKEYRGQIQILR